MTESNVKKWYVVRAVSGQENKVKAYIETEINRLGMSDYISQVLVPTEKVVQVRDGKKITKDKVYFPGYVMIEANLAHGARDRFGRSYNRTQYIKQRFEMIQKWADYLDKLATESGVSPSKEIA